MNYRNFLKKIAAAVLGIGALISAFAAETGPVSLAGNAYVTEADGVEISKDDGVKNWKNRKACVSVFFSFAQAQKKVSLALRARGNAELEVSGGGKEKFRVKVNSKDFAEIPVGAMKFSAGYQRLDIRVVSKKARDEKGFAEISDVLLSGVVGEVTSVRDFDPYWGRRGPSVHLTYELPKGTDAEYFYNEVFVPEGEDPLGTYCMACGFAEGYFGMQVNSLKERRVLFSVWSPFDTQNPKEIPDDEKIVLAAKGEGVNVGEFGNEGSGGQSFLRFPWRAGTTYAFLLRVRPADDGYTEYSAYFFAPEEKKWRFIATFRRPKTKTWLQRPHSFLENFYPEQGWRERCVHFSNQWVRDTRGSWHELTKSSFSCDETGNKKVRLDYAGGVSADKKYFFLKNCGFFSETTPAGTLFSRKAQKKAPKIDFAELEALRKNAER